MSQFLFLALSALALAVYSLSAPSALPWGIETTIAARLATGNVDITTAWRMWGYFVEIFAGHFVALACVASALAAGLLATMLNRYFGWRVATAGALVWIFLPCVWNSTVLGTRGICMVSGIVILVWELDRIANGVLRRARAIRRTSGDVGDSHDTLRARRNRRFAWGMLAAAGVFSVIALVTHDYQLGEPAGVYARGVVREAGDRIIVLNGIADEQVLTELMAKGRDSEAGEDVLRSITSAGNYHPAKFTAQVKAEWPEQTNFWAAAEISPGVFLREASKEYGSNFYQMNGRDTTLTGWKRRWDAAKACLMSRDPFVPVLRRIFAYEGNCIANTMQDEVEKKGGGGDRSSAWKLYRRIYEEVDPGNFAALVNQSEMIRRGYKISDEERRRINRAMDDFFADPVRRAHAREIVRASGPVRSDPELVARLESEARARMSEKLAKGELTELPRTWMTLINWNNEMIASVGRGDREKAVRIAREILSHKEWGGFIPANAILGTATAAQGDYAAAEVFFKTATSTTNAVPAIILNNYAHTLMYLGKLDEAEKMARRAVEIDKSLRVARRTLGEILEKRLASGQPGGAQ